MSDKRLIDANALKNQAVEVDIVTPPHNNYSSETVVFDYDIDDAPTIDAVEVVRCRECKNRQNPEECPMCFTEVVDIKGGRMYQFRDLTRNDGFCHMGAKMDGGTD